MSILLEISKNHKIDDIRGRVNEESVTDKVDVLKIKFVQNFQFLMIEL